MLIYKIITTEINDGSHPSVEVQVTDKQATALKIFKDEKKNAKACFDEEVHEVFNDTKTCYSFGDADDPSYNYYKVELICGELK